MKRQDFSSWNISKNPREISGSITNQMQNLGGQRLFWIWLSCYIYGTFPLKTGTKLIKTNTAWHLSFPNSYRKLDGLQALQKRKLSSQSPSFYSLEHTVECGLWCRSHIWHSFILIFMTPLSSFNISFYHSFFSHFSYINNKEFFDQKRRFINVLFYNTKLKRFPCTFS